MKNFCSKKLLKLFSKNPERETFELTKRESQLLFLRSLTIFLCILMTFLYILILVSKIYNITILIAIPILIIINFLIFRFSRAELLSRWISEIITAYSFLLSFGSLEICTQSILGNSNRESFLAGVVSTYLIAFLFISRVKWRYTTLVLGLQCLLASTRFNFSVTDIAIHYYLIPITMVLIFAFFSLIVHNEERMSFNQALKWDIGGRRLQEFKKLVEKDFPNQILIIGKRNSEWSILFLNEAAIDFFQTNNYERILYQLNNMELLKNNQKSSCNNNNTFNEQTRIFDLLGEQNCCADFQTYLAIFCESAIRKQSSDSPFNTSTRIELKVGKIHWDDFENATLIMMNDISKSERIMHLQTLHEHKDKMLATVSHDLRTPINGIVGMIEMSIDLIEIPKAKKQLKLAVNSANSLLLMINDLLDVSQISKGKLQLNFDFCDVNSIVEPILDLIRFPVKKKGLELIFENTLQPATMVKVDKNRFQQILMNLLGNAVKFTKAGYVKVSIYEDWFPINRKSKEKSIKLQKTQSEKTKKYYCSADNLLVKAEMSPLTSPDFKSPSLIAAAVFCVEDTGIGIKREHLEGLFKEYGKFEIKENKTGVGLGLSISQKLAQRMAKKVQGGIRVSSEEGQGSKFWFALEISNQSSSNMKIQELVEVQSIKNFQKAILNKRLGNKHKIKLLLVDDDLINLLVLKNFVKALDLYYETALNGIEALARIDEAAAKNEFFDLVFMDMNMPMMDGFECTRKINQKINLGEIPALKVIALTGGVMQEDRKLCLMAGMHDVLSKPIPKAEFSKKLEEYLG